MFQEEQRPGIILEGGESKVTSARSQGDVCTDDSTCASAYILQSGLLSQRCDSFVFCSAVLISYEFIYVIKK